MNNSIPREPNRNPARAIREFCLGCVGGSAQEVRLYTAPGCPLYGWRFGKKPECYRKAPSEAQMEARKNSLERAHAARMKSITAATDENCKNIDSGAGDDNL